MLRFLSEHHRALTAISAVWVIAWTGASIVYRLLRRKGFSATPQGEVLFHERFGSGNSCRNLLTRMGGAQNCLLITVTDRELLIRPWFPFNTLFLPEIYDLEHRIPIAQIKSVRERRSWLGGLYVDIEFESSGPECHRITLRLRGKDDFLRALREASGKRL